MKPQSLKSKIILLAAFILLVVGLAVGLSVCKKKKNTSMYDTYTAVYTADEHGSLKGEAKQSVRQWLDGTEITAVPNDGYLFAGWSDNVYLPTRKDTCFTKNIEVKATFISKLKTLKYDYNGATANNNVTSITLNCDDIANASFVIPVKANYEFQGWYLDKEYTKRVTDKDGVYYLGKSIFYSDADTLYARWEKHEGIVYPVLMIFVDEIDAQLDTVNNKIFNLDYKMSLPELKICEQIPDILSNFLNDGFDGLVYFEIDSYFTNIALDKNSFRGGLSYYGLDDYAILPVCMPEVKPFLKNYRSVIVTAGYSDPDNIIHQAGGYGHTKYACIPFEDTYLGLNFSKPLDKNNKLSVTNILSGYIHEFVHTIEQAKELKLNNLHEYMGYYSKQTEKNDLSGYLLYLLNNAQLYEESTGIPFEYWTGEIQVEDVDLKRWG